MLQFSRFCPTLACTTPLRITMGRLPMTVQRPSREERDDERNDERDNDKGDDKMMSDQRARHLAQVDALPGLRPSP